MVRPVVPVISKQKVCEVALDMIDAHGIDQLTIRRIAAKIGVNGASLYHHFKNKDEIVAGAAQLALAETHTPRLGDEGWKTWCLRNVARLRRVLQKHPDLIPVLMRRQALHIADAETDFYFEEFERQGLHIGLAWTLLEMLQAFAVGSVLQERAAEEAEDVAVDEEYPNLERATRLRMLNRDEEFILGCEALVNAIEAVVTARSADTEPARSPRRKSPPKRTAGRAKG